MITRCSFSDIDCALCVIRVNTFRKPMTPVQAQIRWTGSIAFDSSLGRVIENAVGDDLLDALLVPNLRRNYRNLIAPEYQSLFRLVAS